MVPDVESRWKSHMKEQGFTARSCPTTGEQTYEKRYWAFVTSRWPNTFKTYLQWINVKSSFRVMCKTGIWDMRPLQEMGWGGAARRATR
eukprot:4873016-Pyramimonas_sp.AAC.1